MMKPTGIITIGALSVLAGSCTTDTPSAILGTTLPNKELQQVLKNFAAGDTLNEYPKYYAAFIRQELSTGNMAIYLQDQYGSTGKPTPYPTTTWAIDKKLFFVFTGLELISNSYDTTYYHVIRRFDKNKVCEICSPQVRTWKISIKDRKIMAVDVVRFILLFDPSEAPPPPPPILETEKSKS